jgi:hypothetical protein
VGLVPHPMTHRLYDHHDEHQLRGAVLEAGLVSRAATELAPGGAVVVADYGCAQGRVSVGVLVRTAIDEIRASHPELPIFVYHNDLLSNDWSTLFDHLRSDDSYLRTDGGPITPLVSATSFYEPVTPPGTVDLGLSFAAAQWLAEPGPTGGGPALYFDQLAGEARAEMAAQADGDWRRFLGLRHDELVPGGRLVVNLMGLAEGEPAAGHDLWQIVSDVCLAMAADGLIDGTRVDAFVIPVYERTADEVRRPFDDASLGLELLELELQPVPSPALERFRADGDVDALAQGMTGFFRAWSEPSLRNALGLSDDTANELYDRTGRRIAEQAAEFDFGLHAITVLAGKPA